MTAARLPPDNLAFPDLGCSTTFPSGRPFLVHSPAAWAAQPPARIAPERIASLVLADTHISTARGGAVWEYGAGDPARPTGQPRHPRPYFGLSPAGRGGADTSMVKPVPVRLNEAGWAAGRQQRRRTGAQWLRSARCSTAGAVGEDGLSLSSVAPAALSIWRCWRQLPGAVDRRGAAAGRRRVFQRVRDADHFFPSVSVRGHPGLQRSPAATSQTRHASLAARAASASFRMTAST